jgi:6-phosphogluconate dehydrogenase (decarboxylating)
MELRLVGLGMMGLNIRGRLRERGFAVIGKLSRLLSPVISAALFARFASRQDDSPAAQLLRTHHREIPSEHYEQRD